MKLEFWVTVCVGGGDGGDVTVDIDITDVEYDLLIQCSKEEDEIECYAGLGDLCDRIREAAADEVENVNREFAIDEDFSDASYMIQMPDEIWEAAHDDENECDEPDEE